MVDRLWIEEDDGERERDRMKYEEREAVREQVNGFKGWASSWLARGLRW